MPSPQAKALHVSSLQQELLQQMTQRTTSAKTTGQTRTHRLRSPQGNWEQQHCSASADR
jgi:hypothetical protein